MNEQKLHMRLGDGSLELDEANMMLKRDGCEVRLSTQKLYFLIRLVRAQNNFVTLSELKSIRNNLGEPYELSHPTAVSSCASKVRAEIRKAGCDIENKPNYGYRFVGKIEPVVQRNSPRNSIRTGTQSPYVFGTVTEPHQFCGRERELKRILLRITNNPMQHTAVTGPSRIGKSSLLRQIARHHESPRANILPKQLPYEIKWVEIDFHGAFVRSKHGFQKAVTNSLGLASRAIADYDPLELALLLQDERDIPIVFLLDHIEYALSERSQLDDDFWETLRACSKYPHISFITASNDLPANLKERHGYSSEFFNIFGLHLTLDRFSEDELDQLINCAAGLFDDEERLFIHQRSQGWPERAQKLCYAKWEANAIGDHFSNWRESAL